MYVLVALSDGQMTLIDQKYYLEVVLAGTWDFNNRRGGYVYRSVKVNGKRKRQYLHQFIAELAGIKGAC